jgi:RNA polymerase sigma-70 factor (ECF subfamily)
MPEEPLIKQLLRQQSLFMGYLMAMTRDLTAAEEIFQNVAVVVLERGATERVRDFHAWAKEIVRRQALHYLREKSRSFERARPVAPELLDGLFLALEEDAGGEAAALAERDALAECLKSLAPRSRRMMVLRYEKRASFDEIARALDATAQAVQRALSRVRRALHDCVRSRRVAALEG